MKTHAGNVRCRFCVCLFIFLNGVSCLHNGEHSFTWCSDSSVSFIGKTICLWGQMSKKKWIFYGVHTWVTEGWKFSTLSPKNHPYDVSCLVLSEELSELLVLTLLNGQSCKPSRLSVGVVLVALGALFLVLLLFVCVCVYFTEKWWGRFWLGQANWKISQQQFLCSPGSVSNTFPHLCRIFQCSSKG